ncbi:exodeoxyribonuclease VII large subunit, partial [Sphingomonas sp. Leaf33]|uniref:exodeoxyribonuclease VII large subunit n=1 Tax=Sphingomonas sp. Leaf33 TaxID=1736215 RepID=UPI0039E0A567
ALRPSVLDARLARARDRASDMGRLLESVNPEKPLERGYAWVATRPGGEVVGTADAARTAAAMTLHFRDGTVDVRLERAGAKSHNPAMPPAAKPTQPELF